MVTTIDFAELVWIKVAAVAAVLMLPLALFVGVAWCGALALAWVFDTDGARAKRRKQKTADRARWVRNKQRAIFIESLPKKKDGGLFPLGTKQLKEYDREQSI